MTKEVDQVLESEVGNRSPVGVEKYLLMGLLFLWALFQVWYASPLPFIVNILVFNDTEARSIHLAFAMLLAFLTFGFYKKSPKDKIPLQDWFLALLGLFCALYIFIFYESLAGRSGDPILMDILFSLLGLVLLLEATRRSLGFPLVVVASIFLFYSLAGPYMPESISHKGASLNKLLSHQWLTTEGVFGVALGVSTGFVFLFVLFGALLDRAGAGEYFIRLAYSLMGHMRGGPAKAAVMASGLSGIISGSSISNVVTTGTFTIPLMKKVGFPDYKAGAVEVAASTNGQLTPPVMGAAAFLMVEYVGVSYIEVIKHAILPALISYIALFYIVHLEAVKAGMKGIPHKHRPLLIRITNYVLLLFLFCLLGLIVYYGISWIKVYLGEYAFWVIIFLLSAVYLVLLYVATPYYKLNKVEDIAETNQLPPVKETLLSGLHYIFPIVILLWCLTVERYSPSLSAFYAVVTMFVIILTQKPIISMFQGKKGNTFSLINKSLEDLFFSMINGSKNMVGIGIATATAGIVVGTITLTGIGQVMTEFILQLSAGNIILTLLLTAVICLLLGMGLPTTANYIVVSSLMAPVIVNIGALSGFVVPLIAVHLFVFYFGILADDTPPVGLAAFAASGIAGSDPIKTGLQGFAYDIRTAILPFMFIFNNQLLLIGVENIFDLLITVVFAVLAMLTFSAATQRYWLVRTKWWEVVLLLLISFTFFRPGFWLDLIQEPYIKYSPDKIYEIVENKKDNPSAHLRMVVEGSSLSGDIIKKTVILDLPNTEGTAQEIIESTGLTLSTEGNESIVNMVIPGSPAYLAGIDFDWKIILVEEKADRVAKELFYIPVFLLLVLLWNYQRRRRIAELSG